MRRLTGFAAILTLLVQAGFGQGSVLLVGGGSEDFNDWSDVPYRWLVQHAANGNILILHYSTASTFLPPYFRWLGAASATNLVIPSAASANDSATVNAILACDGIFLRGGDQWQYISLWRGTRAEAALRQVFQRGGVIGGTSAGMAVLTQVIIDARRASVDPQSALRYPLSSDITFTEGFLGFLPGVIGDTHFFERGRLGRLLAMLAVYREQSGTWITGVGVDYNTALGVDPAGGAEVMGAGTVTLLRATAGTTYSLALGAPLSMSGMRMDLLTAGYKFDFSSGEIQAPAHATSFTPADAHIIPSQLTLDGSGSPGIWTGSTGSLSGLVATVSSPGDTVGVISQAGGTPGSAAVCSFLGGRGIPWRLIGVGGGTGNDPALASQCSGCRGFVFVSNRAESLAGYFGSTPLGATFDAQIRKSIPVLMLSSDCALAADSAVGGIESDADGAYYGTLTLIKGLGLARGIEFMPRLYENADSIDNRLSGFFWGMGTYRSSYGLLLDGGTMARLSSDGRASISGASPSIIVDGRGVTSLDFPAFHAPGKSNPRVGAALVNALVHVVPGGRTFDLVSGSLLGTSIGRLPLPDDPYLWQNYPNPFNPATRVQFRLSRHEKVRLAVYDMTGREIAVLLHGPAGPGTYGVTFVASGLASGVYMCRLTTSHYSQTRTLVLIR